MFGERQDNAQRKNRLQDTGRRNQNAECDEDKIKDYHEVAAMRKINETSALNEKGKKRGRDKGSSPSFYLVRAIRRIKAITGFQTQVSGIRNKESRFKRIQIKKHNAENTKKLKKQMVIFLSLIFVLT
jgi:hypothetical protein